MKEGERGREERRREGKKERRGREGKGKRRRKVGRKRKNKECNVSSWSQAENKWMDGRNFRLHLQLQPTCEE